MIKVEWQDENSWAVVVDTSEPRIYQHIAHIMIVEGKPVFQSKERLYLSTTDMLTIANAMERYDKKEFKKRSSAPLQFWRIKHLPTGMFYKPSRHGNLTNLSAKGKAYTRKPTMKHLGGSYRHPLPPVKMYTENVEWRNVVASEWEIIGYGV